MFIDNYRTLTDNHTNGLNMQREMSCAFHTNEKLTHMNECRAIVYVAGDVEVKLFIGKSLAGERYTQLPT